MTFRKRKSFSGDVENMDDTQPLLDEEPDQREHSMDGEPEAATDQCVESGQVHLAENAEKCDKGAFFNITTMGTSFMFIFTAFNTNGIISVSLNSVRYY